MEKISLVVTSCCNASLSYPLEKKFERIAEGNDEVGEVGGEAATLCNIIIFSEVLRDVKGR